MFIIRRAKVDDAVTLFKLAKMVHFINLPPDREIIVQKIIHSRNSFLKTVNAKATPEPEPVPKSIASLKTPDKPVGLGVMSVENPVYMFVMEDTDSGGVLGTSQLVSKMGGPGNPNVSFKLSKREFFSTTLQTGTTHLVAQLHLDDSAPTEIGGLILQPSYRGHKRKLGRFLAYVRFHFIGLHRQRFADRVLAELMAAISADGDNLLWDYLGRRFVPLSYDEADRFCQYSREFITSLLPKEEIYLSLLPPTARAGVGEVGAETRPARRMLEKLGFEYRGFVDPFDGGPHLDCATDDITLVKDTAWGTLGEPLAAGKCDRVGIMSYMQSDGDFFAVCEPFTVGRGGKVQTTREVLEALHANPGDRIGLTPIDGLGKPKLTADRKRAKPTAAKKPTTKKATKKTTSKPRSPKAKS